MNINIHYKLIFHLFDVKNSSKRLKNRNKHRSLKWNRNVKKATEKQKI